MQCPSCKSPCLETDTRCLNCRRLIDSPPERSAANVCGFLFAAFGAAALTFGPTPTWIDQNQALLAGIGGLVGGIVGAIVGLIIDRLCKGSHPGRDRHPSLPRIKPL
jgi:hypothetical protein